MEEEFFQIQSRRQVMVNTDPQRRCYNGCNFSEELQWTGWETIDFRVPKSRLEQRLLFWQDLNDYAVRERGKGAFCEFQAIPYIQEEE